MEDNANKTPEEDILDDSFSDEESQKARDAIEDIEISKEMKDSFLDYCHVGYRTARFAGCTRRHEAGSLAGFSMRWQPWALPRAAPTRKVPVSSVMLLVNTTRTAIPPFMTPWSAWRRTSLIATRSLTVTETSVPWDGDGAAAMRYTEARMSKISTEYGCGSEQGNRRLH